jgi:hypothetical protein
MFSYRKRRFLSPASTGHTSYILAEVESSRQGEYPWGTNMLTLSDCHNSIRLEFFLGTAKARRQSLKKINALISDLVKFGHALKTEKELIEAFEKKPKKRGNK